MDDELLRMKNLGKTSAQWLHAAGIHKTADLRRLGAIQAYQAVKSRGIKASKVLLYAIEGALLDKEWKELHDEHKKLLNRQLERRDNAARSDHEAAFVK